MCHQAGFYNKNANNLITLPVEFVADKERSSDGNMGTDCTQQIPRSVAYGGEVYRSVLYEIWYQ